MKKVLALIICVLLSFSITACKDGATPENNNFSDNSATKVTKKENKKNKGGKSTSLSLYFSYSDSLDPYKSQSAGNRGVCSLLFDSLVKLDNDLNPQNLIASNVEVSGKTIAVTLNSYQFSDGSYIDADDVVYSIGRCKGAKVGDYAGQLENVKSYQVSDGKVYITLKRYDKNASRLLDFPILKEGTANKTNDDGKHIPPIGSGRYIFVDNKGEYSLVANENYFGAKAVNTIALKNIPDYDALEYLIRSGSIDVYYSGFDLVEMPELKGTTKNVNLTNLVYVGINQKYGALNDKNVRSALSFAVDRSDISEKCYYSLSKPALSLYNDGNSIIKGEKVVFNLEDNASSATTALAKSGYDTLNKEGYYQNEKGEVIVLSLLYNSENNVQSMVAQTLVKNFKSCGIKVTLNGVPANEYKSAVNNGNYQLYVAEIRLTKSFDYTNMLNYPKNVLLKPNGKGKNNVDFSKTYEKYMKGETTVEEMQESFFNEMPFIPLVFRQGTVTYRENFSKELISSISDPYYNIEQIHLK